MTAPDLKDAALRAARDALHRQHIDRTSYSRAKAKANATCGEFKTDTLSALIESGYMVSMGKQTEDVLAQLDAAIAAQPAPDWIRLYEELRAAIDGGSESMTHADALAQVKACRCGEVQPAQVPAKPKFPTMLRKMWSGGEVQAWIDGHWGALAAQEPQGWIACSERMPEARGQYLVVIDEPEGWGSGWTLPVRAVAHYQGSQTWDDFNAPKLRDGCIVTYWQPLAAAPIPPGAEHD